MASKIISPAPERRVVTSKVLLRTAAGKPCAEGYASVFNSYSGDLGGFREMIVPGAFSRAINERQDVRCLLNHDANIVLGRTKSGTLALAQDSRGLHFRCDLPDTQAGRDLRESMDRGDIDQCSFGFSVVQPGGDDWDEDEADGERFISRRVKDVNLYDVSCVTYPAYSDTSCQVAERTLIEARAVAKRAGVVIVPTVGRKPYVAMSEKEIQEAAEYERALKGRAVGETPYRWERGK